MTVATFAYPIEAEARRLRLEAEGVPTFLDGERVAVNVLCAAATGGLKLQVPRELAAEARVLLDQSWVEPPIVEDLDDAWDELEPVHLDPPASMSWVVTLFLPLCLMAIVMLFLLR